MKLHPTLVPRTPFVDQLSAHVLVDIYRTKKRGTAMSMPLIAYLRVSTREQGRSGLGIEAQRQAIVRFAQSEGFEVIAELAAEIETGKGFDALEKRPQLAAALAEARRHRKCPVAVYMACSINKVGIRASY